MELRNFLKARLSDNHSNRESKLRKKANQRNMKMILNRLKMNWVKLIWKNNMQKLEGDRLSSEQACNISIIQLHFSRTFGKQYLWASFWFMGTRMHHLSILLWQNTVCGLSIVPRFRKNKKSRISFSTPPLRRAYSTGNKGLNYEIIGQITIQKNWSKGL